MKTFVLALILALPLTGWCRETETKADALRSLRELRTQNVKRLTEIDQTLSRTIGEMKPGDVENAVASLKVTRREHLLRQEFLDRMIFQVDTKFVGGDFRQFVEVTLTEMAKIDALTSAVDNGGLWKFMKFAADAVRRLPEQKENIVSFLEGYMNRSVSNPVRPDEFLSTRNYTNGAKAESGKPVAREDVGALADKRLRELEPKTEPTMTVPLPPVTAPAMLAPTPAAATPSAAAEVKPTSAAVTATEDVPAPPSAD